MSNDLSFIQKDINEIKETILKMDDRIDAIDKTLVKQHESIKYHIRRTDLAEQEIDQIRDMMVNVVMKHINQVNGIMKFLAFPLVIALVSLLIKLYFF